MKTKKSSIHRAALAGTFAVAGLFAGGCASIVHGGPRTVTVNTTPPGAKATVTKADGSAVSVNTTPFTVALEPKRGYFKGQHYKIHLELPGYRSEDIELRPTLSGWYAGNIIFGGLIGMLIVDPLTGSMWNLSPEWIDQPLSPTQARLIHEGRGFVVVLASQVTERERANMVRIN